MRHISKLAFLVLLALLTSCSGRSPSEPIVIGHIAALSGPRKTAGEHARQGILLAVEEVNREDNQIEGRHVNVLHVDSRGDPERAQADAVRLITVNRVTALLGGSDSAEAERMAQGANPYSVPVVSSSAPPTAAMPDNLFATGVSLERQGHVLGHFVKDEFKDKVHKIAVIGASDDNAPLVTAFLQEIKGAIQDDQLSYKPAVEGRDAEVERLAGHLEKHPADAVLVVAAAPEFVKALREQIARGRRELVWLYAGTETQLSALQEDTAAGKGMYLATVYLVDNGSETGKQFAENYQKRFGRPPDVHAALAYDDARLLFEAIRRAKSALPAKIRDELGTIESFESVTGTLTITKEHTVRRPVFVVRMEDGHPRLIKRDEGK